MKYLFFINSLAGGGAERVLVNLAEEFIRKGHDVTVSMKDNNVAYHINEKVNLHCAKRVTLPLFNLLSPLANYLYRFKDTKHIIKYTKPDVIIASWGCSLLQILLLHGKIPVISSEHNTFDRKHSLHDYINRFWLNRFVKKVVVLSKYDKAFMARKLQNTIVIPNPLSFPPMNEMDYEQSFDERNDILACGRLNAYKVKGFDTLIQCFALIAPKYPKWNLDIAGTGSDVDFERLRKIAHDYGVGDRVNLIGFHRDIADVMKRHSIFALTSRSEGFGMVITEAMAMGCACISFDLTGPGEIIIDSIDGVLVENQNINDFVRALSELIENEEIRKSIGSRAIADVKRYNSAGVALKWENLFNSLI